MTSNLHVCTWWHYKWSFPSHIAFEKTILWSVGCDLNHWLQYLKYPVSISIQIQGKNLEYLT